MPQYNIDLITTPAKAQMLSSINKETSNLDDQRESTLVMANIHNSTSAVTMALRGTNVGEVKSAFVATHRRYSLACSARLPSAVAR